MLVAYLWHILAFFAIVIFMWISLKLNGSHKSRYISQYTVRTAISSLVIESCHFRDSIAYKHVLVALEMNEL
jgi:hypothetical protein